MATIDYATPVTTLDGEETTLEQYRGKVLLIVNVASHCGFTPQYSGLEALWREYRDEGFAVLGFPCNQFGAQEPGTTDEIQQFCSLTYDVSFPMFSKVEVNGADAHPLFRQLKAGARGIVGTEAIKWNFTKFLVERDGTIAARFAPNDTPESIGSHIAAALR